MKRSPRWRALRAVGRLRRADPPAARGARRGAGSADDGQRAGAGARRARGRQPDAGSRSGDARRARGGSPTWAPEPGFPGLALAIALPGARVDLIEATGRKAAVIERLARAAQAGQRARRDGPRRGVGGHAGGDRRRRRGIRRRRWRARVAVAAGGRRVRGAAVAYGRACWWRGRGRATRTKRRAGRRRRPRSDSRPGRCCASSRSRGPATGICTCFARSRPRRSDSRGGRGWRRSGRLA